MLVLSQNYDFMLSEKPNKVLTSLLCGILFITSEMRRDYVATDSESIALERLQLYAEKLMGYDSDDLLVCWINDFIKNCDETINLIQPHSKAKADIFREATRDIRLFSAMINELIT